MMIIVTFHNQRQECFKIIVTGASGQLGGAIVESLNASNLTVTRGTRNPVVGTSDRLVDFDDPGTLDFTGIETLVLVSAGYAEDDVVIARHDRVVSAAERDGVQYIIYTSLADGGDHLGFALAHRWTERRLQQGAIPWTILRNGLYAELIGKLLAPEDGIIKAPFGKGRVAAIARQDLAEVGARVAQDPKTHAGKIYNLVGTESFCAQEVADAIGATYQPGTLEKLRHRLNNAGLLPFQPAMMLSIHTTVGHGFLDEATSDITQLLGRAPRNALAIATAAAQGLAGSGS